jgi:hypothetical protein
VSEPRGPGATQPLRIVDQRTMERIFEVTDACGISREEVRVPLAGEGDGRIHRLPDGVWEIVVPARAELDDFLVRLAATFDLDVDLDLDAGPDPTEGR